MFDIKNFEFNIQKVEISKYIYIYYKILSRKDKNIMYIIKI